jgi:nucleotide-binding universal stress UspA family protein
MTEQPLSVVLALDEHDPEPYFLESAANALNALQAYDLHLLTVVELDVFAEALPRRTGALDEAKDRLRAIAAKLVTGRGLAARHVVVHSRAGMPAHQIVQCATDLDADLILVGTHGRKGLQRLVVGSVAERVVREASCPVFVFRAEPSAGDASVVPRIEPPCSRCVVARKASGGRDLWCEQHAEAQDRRHTYFQRDRVAESDRVLGSSGLHL